jgi:hypothetical protein
MINEIKINGDVIIEALKEAGDKGLGLSDMERQLPLIRCQIRSAVAYLLGAGEIEEEIYGRSKYYYLTSK